MSRNTNFLSKVATAASSVVLSAFFLAIAIAPAIPVAGGGTLV